MLDVARRSHLLLRSLARLLGDESLERVEVATALVIRGLGADTVEPFDCGETLDAVLHGKLLVCIAIDAGNVDVLALGEGTGELLVDGGKLLAVSTPMRVRFRSTEQVSRDLPRGKKLNQRRRAGEDG